MTVLTKPETMLGTLGENTGGLQFLEDMAWQLPEEFEVTEDEIIDCFWLSNSCNNAA